MGAKSARACGKSDISKEHKTLTSPHLNERRGGGYWLWKPDIIWQALTKIPVNEYLVYCDAGSELNPSQKNRLYDYFELLEEKEILGLAIPHTPVLPWMNDALISHLMIEGHSLLQENQIEGNLIILRKSDNHPIIERWLKISREHPELFTDTLSEETSRKSFIEHRHDQSVLHCLMHMMPGSVIVENETYSGKNVPIQPSRTSDIQFLRNQGKTNPILKAAFALYRTFRQVK